MVAQAHLERLGMSRARSWRAQSSRSVRVRGISYVAAWVARNGPTPPLRPCVSQPTAPRRLMGRAKRVLDTY